MTMQLGVWSVCLALLAVYAATRVQKLFNGIRATGSLPGYRVPFQPYAIPGALFATSWWNPGLEAVWHWKTFLYKQFNNDTISVVPFIFGRPAVFTSNLDVVKQIMAGSHKTPFVKMGMKEQGPVGYWGTNLLIAEGDLWRKHRRILGPAFSQKLYELVWSESLNLFRQMITAEGFEDKKTVELPAAQRIAYKFAFYIIGRCGFDFPFNWGENMQPVDGKVSVTEAIRFYSDNIQILHLPEGLLKLPVEKLKHLNICVDELRKFMQSKIAEKERSEDLGNDIFSVLVKANQVQEDSKLKLDYSELINNVFLMMFAGHETTANTLVATLACLAKYPDQQDEVVEQIMSVVGAARDPTFDDYAKLNKVQAAFYEALRMFPAAYITVRDTKEDTVIQVPNSLDGDECTAVPILKGTHMVVDMIGLLRNPRHFEDPNQYKASRWYDVSNESEAMFAFGLGPRACIGRKFALIEAVGFLTMLLRDWKVEPLLNSRESVDEWFERTSKCTGLVTLSLSKVPVRLVRRS